MKGIDLFVRILVFVKILGKSRREEEISILRSARGKLIALKKNKQVQSPNSFSDRNFVVIPVGVLEKVLKNSIPFAKF